MMTEVVADTRINVGQLCLEVAGGSLERSLGGSLQN